MNEESLQGDREIIEIVNKMGGNVYFENNKMIVKKSLTNGIEIDAENIPDLVPILTLLATVSIGKTRIYNIKRLSEKESNRGKVIANELNKLGAKIIYLENELIIEGVKKLSSGLVYSWKDHRIAMTLALASIVATENIAIERFDSIKKSYPSFLDDFSTLGGEIIG